MKNHPIWSRYHQGAVLEPPSKSLAVSPPATSQATWLQQPDLALTGCDSRSRKAAWSPLGDPEMRWDTGHRKWWGSASMQAPSVILGAVVQPPAPTPGVCRSFPKSWIVVIFRQLNSTLMEGPSALGSRITASSIKVPGGTSTSAF